MNATAATIQINPPTTMMPMLRRFRPLIAESHSSRRSERSAGVSGTDAVSHDTASVISGSSFGENTDPQSSAIVPKTSGILYVASTFIAMNTGPRIGPSNTIAAMTMPTHFQEPFHSDPSVHPIERRRLPTSMTFTRHALATLAMLGLAVAGCSDGGDKPISEQTCAELADTFRELKAVDATITPESDPEILRQNSVDATALNDRVDELGGCPNEPALQ